VQTGTVLQVSGSCSLGSTTYPFPLAGTVDPGTGAFSVAGAIPGLCVDLVCSGTGDGEETHITCTSSTSACNVSYLATKCGNGVIDPLENCEDGNHADGACCGARCRVEPAGTACTSDANECTDDVCNAIGMCTHVPITSP
jgi:cysteine-rich repeat protein